MKKIIFLLDGINTTNIIKYNSGGQEEYSITHDTLSIGNYIIGSAYKRIK